MSIKRILQGSLGLAILMPFAFLAAAMVFGPPAMLIVETIDLIRMRDRAQGQVDAIEIQRGGKGTSRAKITYHFPAAGRIVTSDRYVPGWLGNSSSWTGGGRVANDFSVGQPVSVYYSAQNPNLCALEYGWFCWSVGPTFAMIGLIMIAFAGIRLQPGILATCILCTGAAFLIYGACELFLGPAVVRVSDLYWHAIGLCAALAGAELYALGKKRFPGPSADADSHEASAADQEHSTPYLLFELILVATLLTVIVLGSAEGMFTFATLAIQGLVQGIADASQLIATVAVFVMVDFTASMYVFLSCAVFSCCRKVLRRIAWHISRRTTRIQEPH